MDGGISPHFLMSTVHCSYQKVNISPLDCFCSFLLLYLILPSDPTSCQQTYYSFKNVNMINSQYYQGKTPVLKLCNVLLDLALAYLSSFIYSILFLHFLSCVVTMTLSFQIYQDLFQLTTFANTVALLGFLFPFIAYSV